MNTLCLAMSAAFRYPSLSAKFLPPASGRHPPHTGSVDEMTEEHLIDLRLPFPRPDDARPPASGTFRLALLFDKRGLQAVARTWCLGEADGCL